MGVNGGEGPQSPGPQQPERSPGSTSPENMALWLPSRMGAGADQEGLPGALGRGSMTPQRSEGRRTRVLRSEHG